MSLILLILFILFVYFIVFPLFRVGKFVYKTRKQMKGFYNAQNGNAGSNKARGQQQQPRQTEKKIDPNVGEYVEFEELADNPAQTQANTSHTNYAPSSPIEDAEWEDIN
jgi:hypothetical protein